jgi:hypothetical protein
MEVEMKQGDLVWIVGKLGGQPYRYAKGIVLNPQGMHGMIDVLKVWQDADFGLVPTSTVGESMLYPHRSIEPLEAE